jgi:hypothetical protein
MMLRSSAMDGANVLHMAHVVVHDVTAVLPLGATAVLPLFRFRPHIVFARVGHVTASEVFLILRNALQMLANMPAFSKVTLVGGVLAVVMRLVTLHGRSPQNALYWVAPKRPAMDPTL